MGHRPVLLHPMLSAAIVRSVRKIPGEYPSPSIPQDAWGKNPVVYRALAFLLILFFQQTCLFLGFDLLFLSLIAIIVRLTTPVVPKPRYLAEFLTDVVTPWEA